MEKKLTLEECQQIGRENFSDTVEFDLCGSCNRRFKAKWLDAYYGFFELEGLSGYVTIPVVESLGNFWCENVEIKNKD
jgi:hypothetical protein